MQGKTDEASDAGIDRARLLSSWATPQPDRQSDDLFVESRRYNHTKKDFQYVCIARYFASIQMVLILARPDGLHGYVLTTILLVFFSGLVLAHLFRVEASGGVFENISDILS